MPAETIMGDQDKSNDTTTGYDIDLGFTTLRHEVNMTEDATTCKLALQSDYFVQCSNRFELKYRLAQLFVSLAKKMHLDLVKCHDKHTTLCCEAGLKTRAILFGSCTLEVVQAIRVMGSLATIALQWTHPMPEESIRPYPHVAKGIQKRSNFVRLFNNLWAQQLKNEVANLVNQIKVGKDITSFSHVQNAENQSNGKNQNLSDAEMLKKMEIDADHEAQIIQRLLMKTHISTQRSALKPCRTEIPQTQTQTQTQTSTSESELESGAEVEVEVDSESESKRLQRSKSLCERKHSSLKKKKMSKSRSQSEIPRVMFSNSHSVHELSLSRESREARMGPEGTAVYSDGKPKPLVSVKTGAFVWPNISTSTRKAIAPFNFSEDGSDLKMGPVSDNDTEAESDTETLIDSDSDSDSETPAQKEIKLDSSKDVLPLKKRAFGKRKSGVEVENGQENQKPGTQFPLALQVASSSLSSLFTKGNSGKSKRKSALRRSSSSKRLRRHDTSSYLSSQSVAQTVSTTPSTENNLIVQPTSTLVN